MYWLECFYFFFKDVDVHTCDPQTEFDCSFGDSDQCVPLDVICDGKMDCSGGEDETRVFCSSSMHGEPATRASG